MKKTTESSEKKAGSKAIGQQSYERLDDPSDEVSLTLPKLNISEFTTQARKRRQLKNYPITVKGSSDEVVQISIDSDILDKVQDPDARQKIEDLMSLVSHIYEQQKASSEEREIMDEHSTALVDFTALQGKRAKKGTNVKPLQLQFEQALVDAIKLGSKDNDVSQSLFVGEILRNSPTIKKYLK